MNFFLHQIKRTNGAFEKGIVVKESWDEIRQGYHAYLGAYAYGHDANTDYVSVEITDMSGARLIAETWAVTEPAPEPNE